MDLQYFPAEAANWICSIEVTDACCPEIKANIQGGPGCSNGFDANAAAFCFSNIGTCCTAPTAELQAKVAPVEAAPAAKELARVAPAAATTTCSFPFPPMDLQYFPAEAANWICSIEVTDACCPEIKANVQGGPGCGKEFDANAAAFCFSNIGTCCTAP